MTMPSFLPGNWRWPTRGITAVAREIARCALAAGWRDHYAEHGEEYVLTDADVAFAREEAGEGVDLRELARLVREELLEVPR